MKIKFIIFFIIFFLSANINAAISQSGITNLTQLDSNGIIGLISGNQLTGFISDGPHQGPVVQTFFKNGKYETIFEGKIYKGVWKVENKKYCSKNNTANNFNCVYWYTGNKDGGTYAYIIAQGKIFHQYHEVKSVVQAKAEEKKKAQDKKTADPKKAEEKSTKQSSADKKFAAAVAKKAEECTSLSCIAAASYSGGISACPSGYQEKNEYEIHETHIRFKGEGEFSMCVNQDRPDLHNARDNWGLREGWRAALIKCGDIFVRFPYEWSKPLLVKSSVGFVNFDKKGYASDGVRRNFAKNNKVYKEYSYIEEFRHQDSPKTLELKRISRDIVECEEVTF